MWVPIRGQTGHEMRDIKLWQNGKDRGDYDGEKSPRLGSVGSQETFLEGVVHLAPQGGVKWGDRLLGGGTAQQMQPARQQRALAGL